MPAHDHRRADRAEAARRGQERLAPELDGDERRALMRAMLDAGRGSGARGRVSGRWRWSAPSPAPAISPTELGIGLGTTATCRGTRAGCTRWPRSTPPPDAVLYLAGDLPLVTAAELRALRDAAPPPGSWSPGPTTAAPTPCGSRRPPALAAELRGVRQRAAAPAAGPRPRASTRCWSTCPGWRSMSTRPRMRGARVCSDEEVALGLSDQLAR